MVVRPRRVQQRVGAPSTSLRSRWSTRAWLSFAGVAMIIAVAGASVFALRDRSEPVDPNGPESIVRQYLDAVAEHREEAALAFLTDDLKSTCEPPLRLLPYGEISQVTVSKAHTEGTGAIVDIDVTLGGGGLERVGGQVTLTETADGWRISAPQWPLFGCSERAAG